MSINEMIGELDNGCARYLSENYSKLNQLDLNIEWKCGDLKRNLKDLEWRRILCSNCTIKKELLITIKEIIKDKIKEEHSIYINAEKLIGEELLSQLEDDEVKE